MIVKKMKQEEELDDRNNGEPGAVVEQNSENKELLEEEISTGVINKGDTKIDIPESDEKELMKSSVFDHFQISKNNSFSSVSSEPSPTISEKLRHSWPLVKFTFLYRF